MKKIRIVVADSNLNYLESLASYMRNTSEGSRFIVTYFSNSEKLSTYVAQGENIDVLLISNELYYSDLLSLRDTSIIMLEDDKLATNDNGLETVYRYQRLNQLVSNVLAIYYEKNETAGKLLARSKQTKVLSFYSPIGGSGKTTVAVNLCKQLALNNAKVFYLNLELFNSTSLYFSSAEDNPSLQIFYYVKAESSQLLSKVEALKKYDPYSMVDYFDLAISADELSELSEADVKLLINTIVETGAYDYVVVDLDSSLHQRNIAVLRESDQIMWNISADTQSLLKTKSFFDEEEKLIGKENIVKDKLLVILNKYTGTALNSMQDYDVTIDCYLPFIESWSTIQSNAEVLKNETFNQEIQAIIHNHIFGERKKEREVTSG